MRGPREDLRRGSFLEVGTAEVAITTRTTNAAETAIWQHVVSSFAIFV